MWKSITNRPSCLGKLITFSMFSFLVFVCLIVSRLYVIKKNDHYTLLVQPVLDAEMVDCLWTYWISCEGWFNIVSVLETMLNYDNGLHVFFSSSLVPHLFHIYMSEFWFVNWLLSFWSSVTQNKLWILH